MPSKMTHVCPECDSDEVVVGGPAEMESMDSLLCKSCGYSGAAFIDTPFNGEPRPVRKPASVSSSKKSTKRRSK